MRPSRPAVAMAWWDRPILGAQLTSCTATVVPLPMPAPAVAAEAEAEEEAPLGPVCVFVRWGL